MKNRKRFVPSPSMAVALSALFVALGGSGYAAVVAANSVNSRSIVDRSIQKVDIANLAITNAKLGANSVTGAKVADGSLTSADLNASAKIRWALVSNTGTVVKSTGGISVSAGGPGEFLVDFGTPTAGRLFFATISGRDNTAMGHTIKVSACGQPPSATSDTYENCKNPAFVNLAHVYMRAEDGPGSPASFYIAMMPK